MANRKLDIAAVTHDWRESVQEVYDEGGAVIDTRWLVEWSRNRGNRSISYQWISEHADPEGLHLAYPALLHNDVEWRLRVLVKAKDTMTPVEGFIDVTMAQWDEARNGTRLALGLPLEES